MEVGMGARIGDGPRFYRVLETEAGPFSVGVLKLDVTR